VDKSTQVHISCFLQKHDKFGAEAAQNRRQLDAFRILFEIDA